MKILLFGKNGQVGEALQRSEKLHDLIALDRTTANFENLDYLKRIIEETCPDFIINAAAYTNVDKAASEAEKAYLINAKAVGVLAETAKVVGATLIHYSTDYVFDGTKEGSYLEDDQPCPINVYGKSKLAGEEEIISSGCDYLIFRTSWVYSAHGHNFIKTIMRLAQEKNSLQIVSDQIGVPTSANLIADITAVIIQHIKENNVKKEDINGIYNLAPSGKTNWYEIAHFIVGEMQGAHLPLNLSLNSITPTVSENYPTPAKRPKNSQLDTKKITSTFNVDLPNWADHARQTVAELIKKISIVGEENDK
jgi:dTDP-4-dehydrorhamnose reductase